MSVVDRGVSLSVLTSGFTSAPGILQVTGPASISMSGVYGGDVDDYGGPVAYVAQNVGYSALQLSVSVLDDEILALDGVTSASMAQGDTASFNVAFAVNPVPPGRYAQSVSVANLTTGAGTALIPVEVVVLPSSPSVTYQGSVVGGLRFTWTSESFTYYTISGFEVEWKLPSDTEWLGSAALAASANEIVIDFGIGGGDPWQVRIREYVDGQGARIYGAWGEFSGTA